ncbi:SpdD protein [Streptomyces sp. ISL-112]|uniref:SpdD protein n=1 Tax=unclassified Streptomyces TaxID=2593676 RepID=UPI001BE5442A|nr:MULTISPECIES: SpdD protein [unclassified Streptomyces]MBT2424812.1 SpdD protein [Streptomyces sp. ISL-112]MBT2463867.1 SpdD protein [Streptomyces sp. ISL-63]
MFTPKIPPPDTAPTPATSLVQPLTGIPHTPACTCHHTPNIAPAPAPAPVSRPAVQLTPGSLLVAAAGGTAMVLIIGTVLVSMLLATAITAASVAICAVVLRSLLNHPNNR